MEKKKVSDLFMQYTEQSKRANTLADGEINAKSCCDCCTDGCLCTTLCGSGECC